MTQQVNLYQPIFRKQRKVFSAVTIAQAAAVFIVGLLLIYGYGRWQLAALGADIDALELQRNAAMLQLQVLSAQARPASRARLIDDKLREAEIEARQKERLLRAFETGRIGNVSGFSAHFTALARQQLDGLWLERVEIRDDGIVLAGAAELGELVPRYLQRLGAETAFAGTEFARLQLARGDERLAPVEFEVSTSAAESAE